MTDGFHKLQLPNDRKNQITNKGNPKKFKIIGLSFLFFLSIILLIGVFLYFPLKDLYLSTQKSSQLAKEAFSALKNKDLDQTVDKLNQTEQSLQQAKDNYHKIIFLNVIPYLGSYINDGDKFLNAGIAGVQAAKITIDTLMPYADLLGLKGKSSFVSGSADDRIQLAVETLDKILPNIDKIGDKITIVDQELKTIDENRYPEKIGNTLIREKLKVTKDLILSSSSLFVDAQPLLKKIPELLGIKEKKNYVVIFQNDAELRATGGFITAYAIFSIDKGKLKVELSDDIYKLDASKKKKFKAPEPILKYHKDVNFLELRDSNLSPDYLVSMQSFEQMINDSLPDFPEFDGIIALDTHVLVSAIKVLGDFNISGRNFSAENDKRCDCPKAIYELEDYATKPVAYVREDRKDIISALLYQIMQRALGVSPSKYWGKLSQVFIEEANQKHILFYFHDADAQKGIESLNFGGRIKDFAGDYLHINDVNFSGAKSNLFVEKSVKQEIKTESDGSIVTTLTIIYKNPAPASNCNLEAGQLCLNGILRNWIRVYTPIGSTLIEFKGSEKDTSTYTELGKTVFDGFHTVKPLGVAELVIKYRLPFKLSSLKPYNILIQKQPGLNAQDYSLFFNGREIEKYKLLMDKLSTFKD